MQWTLVAMNIDRLVAITWPFWARAHITQRVNLLVLLVIVLFTFANGLIVIIYYDVVPTTNNLVGKLCTGYNKGIIYTKIFKVNRLVSIFTTWKKLELGLLKIIFICAHI